MDWYPLRLSVRARLLVFGGRAIAERLGKKGLPDWPVAETWEVSDVDGYVAEIRNGPLAGMSLRQLTRDHPEDVMGPGWRGDRFPLLTKFIDASGTLPVHLHADDAAARELEGEPNGKTEAWHILDAAPGATALCGVKPGVTAGRLRQALLDEDFDAVLRRLPVSAGQTIYVPGGTPHTFGPGTLVYEIEQTSDIGQHAMRWHMEDGSPVTDEERQANLDVLLREVHTELRPDFTPGLKIGVADGVQRVFCCAGPYFALERWQATAGTPLRHRFSTAQILANAGAPVEVTVRGRTALLDRAESLLLPAALEEVQISGPADVLFGYLPDLDTGVRQPLTAAGYGPQVISALGEGL
jgi:mannose-6-phosphate isomerase class I